MPHFMPHSLFLGMGGDFLFYQLLHYISASKEFLVIFLAFLMIWDKAFLMILDKAIRTHYSAHCIR